MKTSVTKSQFKPQALKYIHQVATTKKPLTITHFGKPVVKIITAHQSSDQEILAHLQDSVLNYTDPLLPIETEWKADHDST